MGPSMISAFTLETIKQTSSILLNYGNLFFSNSFFWKIEHEIVMVHNLIDGYQFSWSINTFLASTICPSIGELTVTPCDSDVTWRSDGHF